MKRRYEEDEEELSEECRAFREHPEDPFLYDSHLPYCKKCKRWLANRQRAQEENDYWAQEIHKSLGECGGENGLGWQDCTDQNDKDILDAIGPKKKEGEE
jgi:hypothetical protein